MRKSPLTEPKKLIAYLPWDIWGASEKVEKGWQNIRKTVDTDLDAANTIKELLKKLQWEKNIAKWKEVFDAFVKEMQSKVGEGFKNSRSKVYLDTLQKHIFSGSKVKESYPSGIQAFGKTFSIPFSKEELNPLESVNKSEKTLRELTPEEEKNIQAFSKNYLETALKNGERLTFWGKPEKWIFSKLEQEILEKNPGYPPERVKIFIANLKWSIKKAEETFAGTSSKAIAYESLNWTLKNVPGARSIQETVWEYLKSQGIWMKEIDEKTRKGYVDAIYDKVPTSIIPLPNQTIRNLIRWCVDMAIDTKKVTIEGGEFQNTAINALGNITGSVSSKNIGETVNVGATKKDMKTIDFAKIFENGAANVNRKDFDALMSAVNDSGMVKDPLAFLKGRIWETRYREFCLYASSMNFQTQLLKDWDSSLRDRVAADAQLFEEGFRKGLGKMEMVQNKEVLQWFPNLTRIFEQNPETLNNYFQNPSYEWLRKLIREGKVPERNVDAFLTEISKFSQKKQQENLVAIKEIPSDVLNTKVIINGKEKAIKLLSSDEIIALQADSKDFPEPIKKYFEYKLQNKNLWKAKWNVEYVRWNEWAKKLLIKSAQDESLTKTPEYQQTAERANAAGIVGGWQAEIETIAVANGMNPEDVCDPWKVEKFLEDYSWQLSGDEIEAYRQIQRQHHVIGEQVGSIRQKYWEDEAENIIAAWFHDGSDAGLLMHKYEFLESYVYTPNSNGENTEFFNTIIAGMKPWNPDFPLVMPSSSGSEVYYISATDSFNRTIKDKNGNIILDWVPFNSINSMLQELVVFQDLWIDNLGQYIPQINEAIRKKWNKDINPLDSNFHQSELLSLLKGIIYLLDFPEPPMEVSMNPSTLEKYIKAKSLNLWHTLKEQGRIAGIYTSDGNPNALWIQMKLQKIKI